MIFNIGNAVKSKLFLPFVLLTCACNSDSESTTPKKEDPIEVYDFDSRFDTAESSISYTGQTFRHVLINDLKIYIGNLTQQIDDGTFQPTANSEVVGALETYLLFDSTISGQNQILTTTDPAAMQTKYDEISSGKNLLDKLAGKDSVTDHKDWSQEFAGWSNTDLAQFGGAVNSPEGFIRALFETLEEQALDRVNETIATGPNGELLPVHVTPSGVDLQQVTANFLLMGVAFSQGTDDYLDDDIDGKGILSPNTQDEDKPFTLLERSWDEGFGYFGAARDYGRYSDAEIAGRDHIDSNDDNVIDFTAECNFGASINAAERDAGAVIPTDFTGDSFDAFTGGRALITNAGETLTDAEMRDLKDFRDQAVDTWEKAIAATVVHHINETIVDMATIGTQDYDFFQHTRVWSQMKGLALGLQFNPRSPVADDFERLHELLADAPVLTNDDAYKADLLEARNLLQQAYEFDADNVQAW